MTLLELIIASTILIILATAALPVVRFTIVRPKEAKLRRDLREIRDAIDCYKDYADRNLIRVEVGSEGYPPDLEALVKGQLIGMSTTQKVRFSPAHSCGPDDRTRRMESSSRSGRSGFDILGRQGCFRRPLEISSDSSRRHALLGMVSNFLPNLDQKNRQTEFTRDASRNTARWILPMRAADHLN
jgi:type II secretory pathway pseudopilin PulG